MAGEDRHDSEVIVSSWEEPGLFAEIFERHYSAVFGFVGAAVGVDPAGDITSEVFVRAFELRRRYKPEYRSARPWLLGIAANLISDHYRKQARQYRAYQRSAGRDQYMTEFEEEAAARSDARAASPLLIRAMETLRVEEVSVFSLFVLEDMSYRDIAEALGIPEGTVRSRLSRARSSLRNLLADSSELKPGGNDG
jgi:RNA polymerase sigma-70 factor (ECF subfamily)